MTDEKLSEYLWEELEAWGEIQEKRLKRWEQAHPEEVILPDPNPEETLKAIQAEVERRKAAGKRPSTEGRA